MTNLKDIALDTTTHDLDKRLIAISGDDRIAQSIRIALKTFLGEWFLDNTAGFDYRSYLAQKNFRKTEFDSAMKIYITTVDGVTQIVSYSSSFVKTGNTQKLQVNFKVQTENSTILDIEEII